MSLRARLDRLERSRAASPGTCGCPPDPRLRPAAEFMDELRAEIEAVQADFEADPYAGFYEPPPRPCARCGKPPPIAVRWVATEAPEYYGHDPAGPRGAPS